MIALKLIFQSLAGVGATAVCVGGGVYGMTKSSSDSLVHVSNSSYYLVTATKTTNNSAQIQMWTSTLPRIIRNNNTPTQKEMEELQKKEMERLNKQNYTCKLTTDERDDSCNLFNMLPNEQKGTIDLQKIKQFINRQSISTHEINKTTNNSFFQSPKFFLLKVANDKKHLIKNDKTSNIELLSTDTQGIDAGKTYGTLTVHAEITKEKIKGKTNLFIGKVIDKSTQQNIVAPTNAINHKCYFKTKPEDKKSCNVLEITTPNSVKDYKNIEFKTITDPSTQSPTTLSSGKLFLIAFAEEIDYLSPDSKESIVFVETTVSSEASTSPTTKETELKIETPVFSLKTSGKRISQAAIN